MLIKKFQTFGIVYNFKLINKTHVRKKNTSLQSHVLFYINNLISLNVFMLL